MSLPDWALAAIVSGTVSGLVTWGGLRVTLLWHKSRMDGHDTRLNIHSGRLRSLELSIAALLAGRRRSELPDDPREGEPDS